MVLQPDMTPAASKYSYASLVNVVRTPLRIAGFISARCRFSKVSIIVWQVEMMLSTNTGVKLRQIGTSKSCQMRNHLPIKTFCL